MNVAERAFDLQSVPTKRLQMRAASHESDIGARLLQTRPEIPANPTSPDDRDSQPIISPVRILARRGQPSRRTTRARVTEGWLEFSPKAETAHGYCRSLCARVATSR
jgi:hypothetical protein